MRSFQYHFPVSTFSKKSIIFAVLFTISVFFLPKVVFAKTTLTCLPDVPCIIKLSTKQAVVLQLDVDDYEGADLSEWAVFLSGIDTKIEPFKTLSNSTKLFLIRNPNNDEIQVEIQVNQFTTFVSKEWDPCNYARFGKLGMVSLSLITVENLSSFCGIANLTVWPEELEDWKRFSPSVPVFVIGALTLLLVSFQRFVPNDPARLDDRNESILWQILTIIRVKQAHIFLLWAITPLIIAPYIAQAYAHNPDKAIWTILFCFSLVWFGWLLEYMSPEGISIRKPILFFLSTIAIPYFIILIRNSPFVNEIAYFSNNQTVDWLAFIFQAGIFEEILKMSPLILWYGFFDKKRRDRREIVLNGMAIGLGFSLQESILNIDQGILSLYPIGISNAFFILRLLSTPILHVAFTSIAAYHFAASYGKPHIIRWAQSLGAILTVGLFHGLYNFAALTYWGSLIAAFVIIAFIFHAVEVIE